MVRFVLPTYVFGLVLLAAAPARATVSLSVTDGGRTVTDATNHLVWQREVPDTYKTWNEAVKYCADGAGGLPGRGWRLPAVKELLSIVSRSALGAAVDPRVFPPERASDWFWSITPFVANPALAWDVFFDIGAGYAQHYVGNLDRVRCVRSDLPEAATPP